MKKRYHIFFSFVLLISFSWQCAAKSYILFHFKKNRQQLAETVCVNKDVPDNCCKAKCYLEKEIKKEDQRQADLPGLKDKTEKSELYSGYISYRCFQNSLIQELSFNAITIKLSSFSFSAFHPPSMA